ncbi:MAG: hypothetical protein PHC61_12985 [Chitinivibrionales bacterium]|nr:hypothetical protein [Chitinivibrionales bacterium]
MKKSLGLVSALLMCGSVSYFVGCSSTSPTQSSANQEITISPDVMGQLAVSTLSEQQASAQFSTNGATSILSPNNSAASASALARQMGKTSANSQAQVVTIDSSKKAQGILKIITSTPVAGGMKYDTFTVSADTALVNSTTRYAQDIFGHFAGETETGILKAASGPDHDFATAGDNQLLAASWLRMLGSDTLASAVFKDADNDGILINYAAGAPSVVDVSLYERNPVLKPLVSYDRLNLRVVTNGDTTQDKVIRISGVEGRKSGRVSTFVVLDTTGDSTVIAGAMARAIWTTALSSSSSDTVIAAKATVLFKPQNGLCKNADNLFYGINLTESKRFGIISERTFDFTTTNPVADGQKPTSGHVVMNVTFANGKTAGLVADFDNGYFNGTYTGPDGNTLTVRWNANGTVVSSVATN